MEQIQEETILALLIDKPAEGIRILTAQYGGLVYSITRRRLQGCLRKEDIEECVSDVFFELYRCRDKIDLSKGSLKTFLLTIAERQAIKYYERKTDKFDKISLQEQLEKGEEPLSDHNVEQQTIQKEESRLLIEAIKGLGEPTASIVIQKYYYGMTAKEIGQRAGLSKNAVEKRLKRGLEKLKTVLQSEHDQLA